MGEGWGKVKGIIPARAGFTFSGTSSRNTCRDHPRSRGVYSYLTPDPASPGGSSPLARGLLPRLPTIPYSLGIIPARAGFTA